MGIIVVCYSLMGECVWDEFFLKINKEKRGCLDKEIREGWGSCF